ncbi:hypothetical protein KKB55_21705, partial [Myxococcota bacterium]|nr:hypothetical protein [Myxococcota bacterium]
RTGGRAARLAGELRAWEEAGLAIPRGARYVISPEGLAQLRSGALLTPPYAPPPPINLDEIDRQRLTLLRWCWPHTDTARLAQLTGTPRWRLEADLEDLQRRGLAERLDDDLWLPLARCDAPAWNASALIAGRGEGEPEGFVRTGRAAPLIGFESAQDFHGRLAKQLELTSLARFQRFLLSRQSLYTLWEAIQVIRRALEESTLERAHAVFEQVLPLLPDLVGPEFMRVDLTRQLMKLRVALAFAENTPQGFSLALYALVRFSPQIGEAEARLEGLLKLGADLFGAGSGEVLKVLLSQPIPEDIEEARWRQQLMVLAAWFQPLEVEQAVLKRIDEEIAARPELAGPQLALLRGRSAYRQERYAEALEHYEAARQSPRLLDRVKASLAIGSTALDSGDIARCEASARAALEALGALHEPYIEARATYLLRASRYRAGALEAPDEALIEAAGLACAGYYEALILLVEAAFAWRLGDDAAARRWSARAAEIWGEQSHGAKALADALCYVAGGEGDPIAALEAAKALEPDLIAAQVIGLICARHPHPQRAAWIEARLQGRVIDRALRRELISIDEALTLRAPRSAPLAMSPAAPAETARDHSR